MVAVQAHAAIQTVTLDVPGMTCSTCPITVKRALSKVKGVTATQVSYEKRQAIVTFDDAQTAVPALTKATENAGYPSTVRQP
ncbi:MAG: mercury resistance system periplasmic binding protein MerP [Polaromonas sp.]|nr:mercury resistance system periplasmic binding protein MerP [Polaromonas sp.]MDP1739810.1 mercury resistance system periplasmic binding protein MerP [Polaromonas sp.]